MDQFHGLTGKGNGELEFHGIIATLERVAGNAVRVPPLNIVGHFSRVGRFPGNRHCDKAGCIVENAAPIRGSIARDEAARCVPSMAAFSRFANRHAASGDAMPAT